MNKECHKHTPLAPVMHAWHQTAVGRSSSLYFLLISFSYLSSLLVHSVPHPCPCQTAPGSTCHCPFSAPTASSILPTSSLSSPMPTTQHPPYPPNRLFFSLVLAFCAMPGRFSLLFLRLVYALLVSSSIQCMGRRLTGRKRHIWLYQYYST